MAKVDAFDVVLLSVGDNGPFQRRFNVLYNLVLTYLAAMPSMNLVLAMSIPEHWCHVPGREATNYTAEQWKQLTLPKAMDANTREILSSCKMYNATDWTNETLVQSSAIIGCQYGYDYDKTWYDLTVTSQEDWVCDKALRYTNTFVAARFGEMIGAFIFGHLGDTWGRRPLFYISLILILGGKVINLFLTKWYYWYIFGTLVGALTQMPLFQAVMVIASEMSRSKDNSHIAMLQNIGWMMGISTMPLIMWWMRDWFLFVIVTTAPSALFLISNRYMIESPRWLANRGKLKQCEKMLQRIAQVNGTTLNEDALEALKERSAVPEKTHGVMSFFTSWTLARNALMIMSCWIVMNLGGSVLLLNVNNMDGNPFLNYLYQGLVELPANLVGKLAANKIGRKRSAVCAYTISVILSIVLQWTVVDPELYVYTNTIIVLIKFCISFTFCIMLIQGLEIYPTCLRQTGISLGVFAGNALGMLAPYLVYLGTAYDARYPYVILSAMLFLGLSAQLILPETLYEKLPETIADAKGFGKDQKFWHIPRKSRFARASFRNEPGNEKVLFNTCI